MKCFENGWEVVNAFAYLAVMKWIYGDSLNKWEGEAWKENKVAHFYILAEQGYAWTCIVNQISNVPSLNLV